MCILFVWLDNHPAEDGYRIILANNRDEYYSRPSKSMNFWPDHPSCIGGLDQQPGRENGTWMGYNKHTGKVASLLNILQEESAPSFKGRGFLVPDFLTRDVNASSYLEEVHKDAPQYTPFNLVLMEKNGLSDGWSLYYYTNFDDVPIRQLQPGFHGFGNSVLDKPFMKVCHGKQKFSEVVSQFNSKQKKEELEEKLLELMGNNEELWASQFEIQLPTELAKYAHPSLRYNHGPDPQMLSQAEKKIRFTDFGNQLPRICVKSAIVQYGTRTTQLFFVDKHGNCDLIEKDLEEPIDISNPRWKMKRMSFHIDAHTQHLSKV